MLDMFSTPLIIGDKVVFYTQEAKSYNSRGRITFNVGTVKNFTEHFILITTPDGKELKRKNNKVLKYKWNLKRIKEEM